ncbi:hypothetical protein [Amycolatopsis sp. lyj-112]|uniref:hypothetical protein n=1 Tax=Amycolatopsis sp. lyj-112 TaxID=2789288 RepID=UPI00397D197F
MNRARRSPWLGFDCASQFFAMLPREIQQHGAGYEQQQDRGQHVQDQEQQGEDQKQQDHLMLAELAEEPVRRWRGIIESAVRPNGPACLVRLCWVSSM